MKNIVKDNIFEKFTEDSDPIYDMGIGAPTIIKNWVKNLIDLDLKISDDLQISTVSDSRGRNLYYDMDTKLVSGDSVVSYKGKLKIGKYDMRCGVLRECEISRQNEVIIGVWSNAQSDKNLNIIDKQSYIENLLKETQLYDFLKLESILSHDLIYKIKPQYLKYFKEANSMNEKFTEDSDPIDDMGIGIKHIIKHLPDKIIKEKNKIFKQRGIALAEAPGHSLINIMLGDEKFYVTEDRIPTAENNNFNSPYTGKLLLNYSYVQFINNIDASFKVSKSFIENHFPNVDKNKDFIFIKLYQNNYADKNLNSINKEKFIKDIFKKLNISRLFEEPVVEDYAELIFYIKPQYVQFFKEYLNEAFTEDSDPIHDMGIGIKKLIKNLKNNIEKKDEELARDFKYEGTSNTWLKVGDLALNWPSLNGIITSIIEKDGFMKFHFYGNEFKDEDFKLINKVAYIKKILNKLGVLYMFQSFSYKEAFAHKCTAYACDIVSGKIKPKYLKYFKQYLNEGFSEDSDPIHDMGIGVKHIFKDLSKKIKSAQKKIGSKYYYFESGKHGTKHYLNDGDIIRKFSVENDRLIVYLYGDEFMKNGKPVDKEEHIKKVVELTGINQFLEFEKSDFIGITEYVSFKIKPNYIKYFEEQFTIYLFGNKVI